MDKKFIDSVNRKLKSLKKQDPEFYRIDFESRFSNYNIRKYLEEVTDYQLGFISLFEENEKLMKFLEKQLGLLSNQANFRQDIDEGYGTMVRELRLPDDDSSKWQLLYETTLWATNESGPIMHLYFDGWDMINCKIYYWDETSFFDISEEEELAAAKNKIAAFGLQLDSEIGDDAILKIKKILDDCFPNDDTNIHGRKFNLGIISDK